MFSALAKLSLSLPSFDLRSFQPEAELSYIQGNIADNLPANNKATLEKLLDNLSIEFFPTFILYATQNVTLGKLANSIHPFNTFEFFLSTKERIEKTKKIYHKTGILVGFEYFKTQSIQGFACFLEKRHENDELLPYLDDFCEKTKKEKTLLEPLIKDKNFEKFVEEILVNL
ncbi:MAG: hypothetical protein K1060chlam1_01015 [Candidatus Anoxychlamydiales bacterium]|nr:hypothetical protein [Candidatus Anoxychlamydiales bacterium]